MAARAILKDDVWVFPTVGKEGRRSSKPWNFSGAVRIAELLASFLFLLEGSRPRCPSYRAPEAENYDLFRAPISVSGSRIVFAFFMVSPP